MHAETTITTGFDSMFTTFSRIDIKSITYIQMRVANYNPH